jgi:CxxC-x17-CxxC domain-containing protein
MAQDRRIVWEGICSECDKPARLPFVPRDPGRVFCSDCHRMRENERGGSSAPESRSGPAPSGGGLPKDYLKLGYFDDAGNLRKEVIMEEARAVAEKLARTNLAAVKLQGFYNRARMLKDRFAGSKNFGAIEPEIRMLLIDAVDSTGRGVTPDLFRQFVERNVELAAIDAESFTEGFVEHLRCVRAWFLLARSSSNPVRR